MRRISGIAGATAMLAICALLGKVASVAQEGAIASALGASRSVDALLTARLMPSFLAGALGSTLAIAVIPLSQRALREGGSRGPAVLLKRVLIAAVGCFAIAFTCIAPASEALTRVVAPGYSANEITLATSLMLWSFPISLLECIGLALVGFLQAERRFGAAAAASLANATASIVMVVILLRPMGIWGVLLGCGIGSAVQILILIICLRKYLYWNGLDDTGTSKWRSGVSQWVFPVLIGTVAANVVPFTERGLASALEPGSIAILNWAQKILNLPLGLLALPMATAVYPYLAETAGGANGVAAGGRVRNSAVAGWFLLVPASVGLIVMKNEIVATVFMHGAFSASDVLRTASAVGYYGSGLVFIGGFMVLSRISYSAHDPWGPSIATVIASLVYIPAAINLRHQMGVPGLALAYSLSMAVACIALGIRIGVKGREKLRFRDASEFVRIVLAGGAMACCIWLFRLSLGGSRWAGLNGILELCAVLLTGSLAYVIACGLLGSETLRHAFGYLRRRPD